MNLRMVVDRWTKKGMLIGNALLKFEVISGWQMVAEFSI